MPAVQFNWLWSSCDTGRKKSVAKRIEGQLLNINSEKLMLVCAKIYNHRLHAKLYKWKQNEITHRYLPLHLKKKKWKGVLPAALDWFLDKCPIFASVISQREIIHITQWWHSIPLWFLKCSYEMKALSLKSINPPASVRELYTFHKRNRKSIKAKMQV